MKNFRQFINESSINESTNYISLQEIDEWMHKLGFKDYTKPKGPGWLKICVPIHHYHSIKSSYELTPYYEEAAKIVNKFIKNPPYQFDPDTFNDPVLMSEKFRYNLDKDIKMKMGIGREYVEHWVNIEIILASKSGTLYLEDDPVWGKNSTISTTKSKPRLPEEEAGKVYAKIDKSPIKKLLKNVSNYGVVYDDEAWDYIDRYFVDGDSSYGKKIYNLFTNKPSDYLVVYTYADGDILYFICKDEKTADEICSYLPNADQSGVVRK